MLLVLLLALVGCEFSIGGPESAAVSYVRSVVESPAETEQHQKIYSYLPNRVIVQYARALRMQGIDLKYSATKMRADTSDTARVAVAIIPKRAEKFSEREHTLVLELKKDNKQGWSVVEVKAKP